MVGQKWPDASIGIPTGKDTASPLPISTSRAARMATSPWRSTELNCRKRPSIQRHRAARITFTAARKPSKSSRSRIDVLPGVDIRADGGYFIAWGNLIPEDLQAVTAFPEALIDAIERGKRSNGSTQGSPTTLPRQASFETRKEDLAREYDRAQEWLLYIDPSERETWNNVGLSLYGTFGDDGFELWNEWSKRAPEKYNKTRTQEAQWADFKRKNPGPGIGLLRALAVKGGWKPGAETNGARLNGAHHEPNGIDAGEPDDIGSDVEPDDDAVTAFLDRLTGAKPDADTDSAPGLKHRDLAKASEGRTVIVVLKGNQTEVVDKCIKAIRRVRLPVPAGRRNRAHFRRENRFSRRGLS